MPILGFGTFRLDTRALELRRDGRRMRIRPQPCRVLAMLASRPGVLVTREQLRAQLWPDGVFVHFDVGLNSCLKQIRAALGDSAASPRFVETLTRRGYRFVADVIVEDAELGMLARSLVREALASMSPRQAAEFAATLAVDLRAALQRPEGVPLSDSSPLRSPSPEVCASCDSDAA